MKVCSFDGCDRKHYAKRFCKKHYRRNRKHGTPYLKRPEEFCTADGCGEKTLARGFCKKHYDRNLRNNTPYLKKINRICNVGDCNRKHCAMGYCQKHYLRNRKYGSPHITKRHGMVGTPTYYTWEGIKQRCNNPNASDYKNYGGRGIKVCDKWLDFKNFYSDMGDRPKGLEIDRIDNDGDYTPENCRWITHKDNCRNTSRTILNIKIVEEIREMKRNGFTYREIAEKIGVNKGVIGGVLCGGAWR